MSAMYTYAAHKKIDVSIQILMLLFQQWEGFSLNQSKAGLAAWFVNHSSWNMVQFRTDALCFNPQVILAACSMEPCLNPMGRSSTVLSSL